MDHLYTVFQNHSLKHNHNAAVHHNPPPNTTPAQAQMESCHLVYPQAAIQASFNLGNHKAATQRK